MASVHYKNAVYQVQEQESVLDALIRGGADVAFSCRKGSCHVCLLRVLEGEPGAKSQQGLNQALIDSRHFKPCVCRPSGDLVVAPAETKNLRVGAVVAVKQRLSVDVVQLKLEPELNIEWTPGQYISLIRGDGMARRYSISSVSEEDYFLELHVKRVPGGVFSDWIHDTLAVGDSLEIQRPTGHCCYRRELVNRDLILLGTSTGVGPLVGIVRDALRQKHQGKITLYHGARTQDGLYLHAQLIALAAAYPQFTYVPCVSGPDVPAGVFAGRVTQCAFPDGIDRSGQVAFFCGHPNMVYEARVLALRAGLMRSDIQADPFENAHPTIPSDHALVQSLSPDPELWAALENGLRLRAILVAFYDLVFADPRLAPFFHNVTKERVISKQYEFLASILTGDRRYFGLLPFNAHHWMVISDGLFDHREALFDACVRAYKIPEHLHRRWRALDELFRQNIVKSAPRGMIIEGQEHVREGFSVERVDVATLCDGCGEEMPEGSVGRMHRRTGQLFCQHCNATDAT